MSDTLKITGEVHVKLFDENGKLKQEHVDHNLVVTSGKVYLAAWLAAASQAGKFMSYIGVGTGTAAPTIGDTTLQAEFSGGGYSRVLGTLTSLSNTWNNTAVFAPGNATGAVTEAGLFSAITSGTMLSRQAFAVFNKASGDTMTISWTVTIS